jgi:hypothetical protein
VSHFRIEIQDRVRRLPSEPSDEEDKEIEKMRKLITAQLDMLDTHPGRKLPSDSGIGFLFQEREDENFFDDLGLPPDVRNVLAEDVGEAPGVLQDINDQSQRVDRLENEVVKEVVFPERRLLSIPSNWSNVDEFNRAGELEQRIQQASRSIGILKDLIADKSFQFSHVIRVAPRKGVRTRARSYIAKLNLRISYQCRVYTRCRNALIKLGAGDEILSIYKTLKIEHLGSSSVLLNPNQPGSTRVQLSWIWQTGTNTETSSESLRECMSLPINSIVIIKNPFSSQPRSLVKSACTSK